MILPHCIFPDTKHEEETRAQVSEAYGGKFRNRREYRKC